MIGDLKDHSFKKSLCFFSPGIAECNRVIIVNIIEYTELVSHNTTSIGLLAWAAINDWVIKPHPCDKHVL